jgi:hypothetical protein
MPGNSTLQKRVRFFLVQHSPMDGQKDFGE